MNRVPNIADEAAFRAELKNATSGCSTILHMCCRLRGTRARYNATKIHAEILAGRSSRLVKDAIRNAFAWYGIVHQIMHP